MAFSGSIVDDASIGRVAVLEYTAPDPDRSIVVQVAVDRGSNLFDLTYGGTPLIVTDQGRLASRDWTGCFTLFPYPNRIRGKKYRWGGRAIDLSRVQRREGDDALVHGPVDLEEFHCDGASAGDDAAEVTTWFDNEPGGAIYDVYPFPCRLELTYRLTASGVTVTYRVSNRGAEPLPYGFALHPCFAAPEGTQILVPSDYIWQVDAGSLPTGLVAMGSDGYDLRRLTLATDVPSTDTVFTGLVGTPELRLPDGTSIEMLTSGEFKNFVVFRQDLAEGAFICGENQTGSADFLNLAESDDADVRAFANRLVVEPGDTVEGFIFYRVTSR